MRNREQKKLWAAVRRRNESVTCETVHALCSASSACRRAAETLEALLEQMTSALGFIHHYHKANLGLPFKCALSRAHTLVHMRLYLHLHFSSPLSLSLTHTHTHTHTHPLGWCCGRRALTLTAITWRAGEAVLSVLGGSIRGCRQPSGPVMNCCSPGSCSARHIRLPACASHDEWTAEPGNVCWLHLCPLSSRSPHYSSRLLAPIFGSGNLFSGVCLNHPAQPESESKESSAANVSPDVRRSWFTNGSPLNQRYRYRRWRFSFLPSFSHHHIPVWDYHY